MRRAQAIFVYGSVYLERIFVVSSSAKCAIIFYFRRVLCSILPKIVL